MESPATHEQHGKDGLEQGDDSGDIRPLVRHPLVLSEEINKT